MARALRPAVIIMDLRMPVLDGIQATRLLKSEATTRHLRVIAHTGLPASFNRRVLKFFDLVLPKPASPAAVVRSVRGLFGDGPQAP